MFIKLIHLGLVASVAAAVSALSVPAASDSGLHALAKRSSHPFPISFFKDANCGGAPLVLGATITPGNCLDIPLSNGQGAITSQVDNVGNPNQFCVLKYWSNPGCTGTAVTFFVGPTTTIECFESAQNGGGQKTLGPQGGKSVEANCAFDMVPGSS